MTRRFLSQLNKRFGYRLGRFVSIAKRGVYPLTRLEAEEQVKPGCVLIGNAAHTLHPVAGQGFNLALRGVAALAQVIVEAFANGEDISDYAVLKRYDDWRMKDQKQIGGFTHNVVRLFSNKAMPLGVVRGLGLVATDLISLVKHSLSKRTMGISGHLPKLICGIPLQKVRDHHA